MFFYVRITDYLSSVLLHIYSVTYSLNLTNLLIIRDLNRCSTNVLFFYGHDLLGCILGSGPDLWEVSARILQRRPGKSTRHAVLLHSVLLCVISTAHHPNTLIQRLQHRDVLMLFWHVVCNLRSGFKGCFSCTLHSFFNPLDLLIYSLVRAN